MGDRTAKNALYDALALTARALGNGRRAEIVDVLAQGERSVDALATEIGQSLANTSQHLQQLLHAGLVRTRRDRTRVIYRLASPDVAQMWTAIQDIAADHVAEIDQLARAYLGDRSQLDTMTRAELHERLRTGDIVVLDVRPAPEYDAGHIAGALSLPVAELTQRLNEIPTDHDVVAYCRGPYCVYADDAVRTLHRHGYHAARLEDGYPEWSQAGLPTQTPPQPTDRTPSRR